MKELLILRHAKSSWKNSELADHDRPLNKRGKREALRVGKLLQDESMLPDLILSSTAQRARDTVQAVIQECSFDGEVDYRRELYQADADIIIELLTTLDEDVMCVMVVGHNPELEELLQVLTRIYEPLSPAALVKVRLPMPNWSALCEDTRGELAGLWRAREID
jgi:phosphohistidine phosphatase